VEAGGVEAGGADGDGAAKSTVGGLEITASFSTAKFGLGL
jgi:hypothetical protein